MSREFPKNNPPKITLPTVGRIVHVFGVFEEFVPADTPRAGIVAGLCSGPFHGSELCINVMVITTKGELALGGIQCLKHASLPRHPEDAYWDWMDFQKGQAAKTEELEAKLKENATPQTSPLPGSPAHHVPHDTSAGNEMGKLQAGAPSLVDGKR